MKKRFLSALMALICTASLLHAQEYSDETQNLDEVVVTATRMGLPLKNIPQKVEIIDNPRRQRSRLTEKSDKYRHRPISRSIGYRGDAWIQPFGTFSQLYHFND